MEDGFEKRIFAHIQCTFLGSLVQEWSTVLTSLGAQIVVNGCIMPQEPRFVYVSSNV